MRRGFRSLRARGDAFSKEPPPPPEAEADEAAEGEEEEQVEAGRECPEVTSSVTPGVLCLA